MSIVLYDEAVTKKIKNWIRVPGLTTLSPAETSNAFQLIADSEGREKIDLPVITVTRNPEIQIHQPHKQIKSFDGADMRVSKDYSLVRNAIGISLEYQIDIYTKDIEDGCELLRELIFNLINDPLVKIEVPYNQSHVEQVSTLILDESVTANSDTDIKSVYDQLSRWTIKCSIDDAYLLSIPKYDTVHAEIAGVVVEEDTTKDIL